MTTAAGLPSAVPQAESANFANTHMPQRIGLFGGTFDPIHVGHLISARSLAEQARLERVILIPAAQSPHKANLPIAAAAHRLEMCRLAVHGDPLFDVTDVEVKRVGPSYTYDTVRQMYDVAGAQPSLFWLIGADQLGELHRWHRAKDLLQLVTFVTAVRPGWKPPGEPELAARLGLEPARSILAHCYRTPYVEVSASDIRRRLLDRLSVRYMVPDAVASYIQTNALYRESP